MSKFKQGTDDENLSAVGPLARMPCSYACSYMQKKIQQVTYLNRTHSHIKAIPTNPTFDSVDPLSTQKRYVPTATDIITAIIKKVRR